MPSPDGSVFTHELSSLELSLGMLGADGDLAPIAVLASRGLPLPSGGTTGTTVFNEEPPSANDDLHIGHGFLGQLITGPDGWLSAYQAGDMLAVRLRQGQLEIYVHDGNVLASDAGEDQIRDACVRAATKALERYGSRESPIHVAPLNEVILGAIEAEPSLFTSARRPLSAIVREAGLEAFGGNVGVCGSAWNFAAVDRLSRADVVTATKAMGLLLMPAADGDVARRLLEYLDASPRVLSYVADEVERRTAEGTDFGEQLAQLSAVAESAGERLSVLFLRARAAEGAGDPAKAERLVCEVLTIRPDLESALLDAAEYAMTRGDLQAADAIARRTDHHVARNLRSAIARLLTPPKSQIGRNQPCPCGSGKKHKMCCLGTQLHPIADRAEALYALLMTHAQRPAYAETLSRLVGRSGRTEKAALFCLDLLLTRGGAGERFMRTRGDWLRDEERALIESWQKIPPGLFEVRDVRRGIGVTIRTLPAEPVLPLSDRSFSTSVHRLDVLAGRILHDGARPRLLSLPVPVDRSDREELLALLARDASAHELAEALAPRPAPWVRNSDGHDYYDAEVTWRIPGEAAAWLQLARDLEPTSDDALEILIDLDEVKQASRGRVERLGSGRWKLWANSLERLTELDDVVRKAAPDAVEISRRAERVGGGPHRRARELDMEGYLFTPTTADPTPESSRSLSEQWADTVIGRLGGTPREAARRGSDPDVRAEVEMLLDDLEWRNNREDNRGKPRLMDVAWLRKELGILSSR